jgi:hypothetical protein
MCHQLVLGTAWGIWLLLQHWVLTLWGGGEWNGDQLWLQEAWGDRLLLLLQNGMERNG